MQATNTARSLPICGALAALQNIQTRHEFTNRPLAAAGVHIRCCCDQPRSVPRSDTLANAQTAHDNSMRRCMLRAGLSEGVSWVQDKSFRAASEFKFSAIGFLDSRPYTARLLL